MLKTLILFLWGFVSATNLVDSSRRTIQIRNDGSMEIELFWVDPDTKDEVMISPQALIPGSQFHLDCHVGHRFNAKETPSPSVGRCENLAGGCRHVYFEISENESRSIRITNDFTVKFMDNRREAKNGASQLVNQCQAQGQAKNSTDDEMEDAMTELVRCVEQEVAGMLEELDDEIGFQASVRRDIAASLENYTCSDGALNSTEDVAMNTWFHIGTLRDVHIKLDRPAAKIHVIKLYRRGGMHCDFGRNRKNWDDTRARLRWNGWFDCF